MLTTTKNYVKLDYEDMLITYYTLLKIYQDKFLDMPITKRLDKIAIMSKGKTDEEILKELSTTNVPLKNKTIKVKDATIFADTNYLYYAANPALILERLKENKLNKEEVDFLKMAIYPEGTGNADKFITYDKEENQPKGDYKIKKRVFTRVRNLAIFKGIPGLDEDKRNACIASLNDNTPDLNQDEFEKINGRLETFTTIKATNTTRKKIDN
jgi:hypothetical protein